MSFATASQTAMDSRAAFETVYRSLPAIEFEPQWCDDSGLPMNVLRGPILLHPVTTVDPKSNRRMILVPTHRFGTIALFDLWGARGVNSPLAATFVEGFADIDSPFTFLSRTEDSVAAAFREGAPASYTDVWNAVFDRLLTELLNRDSTWVYYGTKT